MNYLQCYCSYQIYQKAKNQSNLDNRKVSDLQLSIGDKTATTDPKKNKSI